MPVYRRSSGERHRRRCFGGDGHDLDENEPAVAGRATSYAEAYDLEARSIDRFAVAWSRLCWNSDCSPCSSATRRSCATSSSYKLWNCPNGTLPPVTYAIMYGILYTDTILRSR